MSLSPREIENVFNSTKKITCQNPGNLDSWIGDISKPDETKNDNTRIYI